MGHQPDRAAPACAAFQLQYHLSIINLGHDEGANPPGQLADHLFGKRPDRIQFDQPRFDSLFASLSHGPFGRPDTNAIRYNRHVRVIQEKGVVSDDPIHVLPHFLNEPRDHFLLGHVIHHRIGEFRADLLAMMLAGSVTAGYAIAVAKPLRAKDVVEPARAPNFSDGIRLGVFLCTCNGTMASYSALTQILEGAKKGPEVAHGEMVFSACHPRGSDRIAAAVKEHRLNRVILASCACCPLEFQCISCNDQRNRTRIHLFDEHGLDRSSFEMINLRDYLSVEHLSEEDVIGRARDLFRAALIRTRFLGPLRQGITEIGKDILILGGSPVGISSALNLDLQGFRVRVVHQCRLANESAPPIASAISKGSMIPGRGILHIEGATIEEISGHIGDFKVKAKIDGKRVRWRADIICLTDENVLSLAIPEELAGLKNFYRYNFAFFHTPQPGLYRVLPRTLNQVNAFEAGAALAVQVAKGSAEVFLKDHELSPRVDSERCRGCGRCVEICPFDAIDLRPNNRGAYTANVLRYNCVGCGGCVGRCPVTALDMPYFSNRLLNEIVSGVLEGAT